MSSIIVVFPKKEIATNIRNILVRNGFDVIGVDRKSTRLNSSHSGQSRMPSSA